MFDPIAMDVIFSHADLYEYQYVSDLAKDLEHTEFYKIKGMVDVDNLFSTSSSLMVVEDILKQNKIKGMCVILVDKNPTVKRKANNRPHTKWIGVEFDHHGFRARVVSCSAIYRCGILIDDEWKWFRSFGNVSVHAKRNMRLAA